MKEKKTDSHNDQNSIPGNLIYSYSRQQAINDGVLVEVDERIARTAGFTIPIAVTHAAWASCIPIPDHLKRDPEQSEAGRLNDLLRVLQFTIRHQTTPRQDQVDFQLALQQPGGGHKSLKLKCVCGPGDDHRPVLTIMLQTED
jgi:hypothetical protein